MTNKEIELIVAQGDVTLNTSQSSIGDEYMIFNLRDCPINIILEPTNICLSSNNEIIDGEREVTEE